MIEKVNEYLDSIVEWMEKVPPEALAIAMGILIGSAATQWIKRTFPPHVLFGIKQSYAVTLLRIVAFVLSALPTFYMWPETRQHGIWVALFVGFATPAIYKIATFFLYKKFPKLEERMSANPGE